MNTKLISVTQRIKIFCLSDNIDRVSKIVSFKNHFCFKVSFEMAAAYDISLRKLQLLTNKFGGEISEKCIILEKIIPENLSHAF